MCPVDWKTSIISSLNKRDMFHLSHFREIITDYSQLRDQIAQISLDCDRLKGELKGARQENLDLSLKLEKSNALKSYDLDQKLFRLQEEVTDLHRQKGALANDVIELNKVLKEKEAVIILQSTKITDLENSSSHLQASNAALLGELHNLERNNQLLNEEKSASFEFLETLKAKNLDLEEDKTRLVERINELQKTVEKLKNLEHDLKQKFTQEAIRRQLAEAASAPVDENLLTVGISTSIIPHKKMIEINANEGNVNCVRFTPSGNLFGSGGSDRKIRLWSVSDNRCELRSTLVGCNAAVTSIDFDPNESVILGASSDFSCRVWTLSDSRLRFSLTGHSEKVVSAKFMGTAKRVVTISSDRTIKLWDVDRCQCRRTIMTSSAPQDVAFIHQFGALVTGHFDHKLRIWDERSGSNVDTITLFGKITGLDISSDCNEILVCTRNDELEAVDLRAKRSFVCLRADEFRVGLDFVRPTFSPDSKYAAAGSLNGSVYIWEVLSTTVEEHLIGHNDTVVCCHWNPKGHSLVSCERINKAIVWGN